MEFIEIKKGAYLSAQQMNDIYNNFLFLKEMFKKNGFDVGEIVDNSVTKDIDPINIMSKFNAVETNIQTIHKTVIQIIGKSENWARVNFYRGKKRIIEEMKQNEK